MAEDKKANSYTKIVELERIYPENLKSYFVDNIIVQHTPDRFVLSFFEVFQPPIIGETEEQRKEEIDELESVEARCVARLVVTPMRMKEFLQAINVNMDKFDKFIEDLKSEGTKE